MLSNQHSNISQPVGKTIPTQICPNVVSKSLGSHRRRRTWHVCNSFPHKQSSSKLNPRRPLYHLRTHAIPPLSHSPPSFSLKIFYPSLTQPLPNQSIPLPSRTFTLTTQKRRKHSPKIQQNLLPSPPRPQTINIRPSSQRDQRCRRKSHRDLDRRDRPEKRHGCFRADQAECWK